jgi:hypothetical protein
MAQRSKTHKNVKVTRGGEENSPAGSVFALDGSEEGKGSRGLSLSPLELLPITSDLTKVSTNLSMLTQCFRHFGPADRCEALMSFVSSLTALTV